MVWVWIWSKNEVLVCGISLQLISTLRLHISLLTKAAEPCVDSVETTALGSRSFKLFLEDSSPVTYNLAHTCVYLGRCANDKTIHLHTTLRARIQLSRWPHDTPEALQGLG